MQIKRAEVETTVGDAAVLPSGTSFAVCKADTTCGIVIVALRTRVLSCIFSSIWAEMTLWTREGVKVS